MCQMRCVVEGDMTRGDGVTYKMSVALGGIRPGKPLSTKLVSNDTYVAEIMQRS